MYCYVQSSFIVNYAQHYVQVKVYDVLNYVDCRSLNYVKYSNVL
jgi:hypothetical protein